MIAPAEKRAPAARTAGTGTQPADIRVLIVDDDAAHRKLLCRNLVRRGYVCDTAVNGRGARALLAGGAYDILVADIVMPGESGLDLAAAVQTLYPDMAVIMATGVEDSRAYGRAAEMGVYGYLIKPVSRNQLLATVESAWQRLSMERENRQQAQMMARLIIERDTQVAALEVANQKILAQQADLIRKERLSALLQLAGATAHEINQPLMIILGCIEMLADNGCPEKRNAYAAGIKAAAERIAHIVTKIQSLHSDKSVCYNAHDRIIDLDGQVPDQGK